MPAVDHRDRAVAEVGYAVTRAGDIRQLLDLEADFEGGGVIEAAPQRDQLVAVAIALRPAGDPLRLLQRLARKTRQGSQRVRIVCVPASALASMAITVSCAVKVLVAATLNSRSARRGKCSWAACASGESSKLVMASVSAPPRRASASTARTSSAFADWLMPMTSACDRSAGRW